MAYKFTDEDKQMESEFKERIAFGVTEVDLVGATAGQTEAGKDYIELTVADERGLEDSARLWFTGGASPYSFQTVRQIVVHTAKSDADKEKARQAAEACIDTDDMANLLNSKCVGKQLWFTKYYDPTRTYEREGKTYRSINTSVFGYEPKLKPELMPSETDSTSGPLDGAEPATGSAADNIPSKW